MRVIDSLEALQQWQTDKRQAKHRWALVPTMGNLHAGHESLIKQAQATADAVIVSIYVNPTQFGVGEDFGDYPRTLAADLARLDALGVHAVLTPDDRMIYPFGREEMIGFTLPERYTNILCGINRPTHFHGVVAVVARLFNLVQPHWAIFGEKDYQQLWMIQRLTRDLAYPVRILSGATVREADGLALSSRNQYLTSEERTIAPRLQQTLQTMVSQMQSGTAVAEVIDWGRQTLSSHGFKLDYLELRRQQDLALSDQADSGVVLLAAAHLGKPRLLDNILF